MIKVLLYGSGGRMGQLVAGLICNRESEFRLVRTVDSKGAIELSTDCPTLVIDFSTPSGAQAAYREALARNIPLVSGTTGLADEFMNQLRSNKAIPIFHSSNMSIGVSLFVDLLKQAQALLPEFKIGIHEVHHVNKKDAPSGTAKTIGSELGFGGTISYDRRDQVIGVHEVTFSSPYEAIRLSHESLDRAVYAKGALDISKWLIQRPAGFYGIGDYKNSNGVK